MDAQKKSRHIVDNIKSQDMQKFNKFVHDQFSKLTTMA